MSLIFRLTMKFGHEKKMHLSNIKRIYCFEKKEFTLSLYFLLPYKIIWMFMQNRSKDKTTKTSTLIPTKYQHLLLVIKVKKITYITLMYNFFFSSKRKVFTIFIFIFLFLTHSPYYHKGK